MLIRPAEPADVPGIAEFQTACWRDVYRGIVEASYLDRVTAADREVRWAERLTTGSRQIALATTPVTTAPLTRSAVTTAAQDRSGLPQFGGLEAPSGSGAGGGLGVRGGSAAIAGVVSWGIHPDRGLELMSLYVGAAHRGSGLGGRLLRHALGSAAAFVWVFEPNVRAIAFYTRHGFTLDGGCEPDPDTGVSCVRMSRPGGGLAGIWGTRLGE